mmetsp:Transcript_5343/g.8261  ORF Transcript_5343/g.8261 Transcript_5343/m.8261 type:complete len:150 (+) Transcript_5343:127-576(+)
MFQISDNRKIGTFLLFLGVFFLFLGVLLLFDRKLLAMGNILFLLGFGFLSGIMRTLEFFGFAGERMKERWQRRWRGILTFWGGIFMVMGGWPMLGMLVEFFGFINLFGSFFPLVLTFLRSLPIVGTFLNLPGVSAVVDKIAGKSSTSMV